MLGAIIGDIIGSPYEAQEKNIKNKDFPLFSSRSKVTDDSVLTCAVAEAFLAHLKTPKLIDLRHALIDNLKEFGNCFQNVPYGKTFRRWMSDYLDKKPYNSFSNGSAMRVSSVGWLFDSLEKVEEMAKISAEVTHNHPEGIKGAQAVAAAIFLARTTQDKDKIRAYINEKYYKLDFTIDGIRDSYIGSLECALSVPQAIEAFLESSDFEDSIRTAVSLGGDSDTIAAMTGSIAEAFYGIPDKIRENGINKIPPMLMEVVEKFQCFMELKKRYGL